MGPMDEGPEAVPWGEQPTGLLGGGGFAAVGDVILDGEEDTFTHEQAQRALALHLARRVLEDRGLMGAPKSRRLTRPTGDLLIVAHYIIAGGRIDADQLADDLA